MEADESAGGDDVVEPNTAANAVVDDLLSLAFARGHELCDDAHVLFGDVDGEVLDGFVDLAVDFAFDDLGAADGHLETFAAEGLNEDRELEFAASLDGPGIGAG